MMHITLVYKGKSERVDVEPSASTSTLFDAARRLFSLEDQNLKVIVKGKQVATDATASAALADGAKCMVMATGKRAVEEVLTARADPTVRSFAAEEAAARHHAQQQQKEELSEWGAPQDAKYRFCRFEPCTWQSFGTRPQSSTPHAFDARSLMLKLSQDPAVVHIMRERQWTVGLLAELDPIDDRLAEKMEGGGKRLLGYNTNAGAQIHIRLRTQDLSGFLPYPALIDTLLHELCHNEVGPHNEHFWHLFCQLKVDYLKALLRVSSRGDLFGGKSALQLSDAAAEVRDVRASVLAALERDRQAPAGQMQVAMLDGYLAAGKAVQLATGRAGGGQALGSATDATTAGAAHMAVPLSAAERRELFAARATARVATAPAASAAAPAVGDGDRSALAGASGDDVSAEAMDLSDAAPAEAPEAKQGADGS